MSAQASSPQATDAKIVRDTLRANGVFRYGRFERENTYGALEALSRLLAAFLAHDDALRRIAARQQEVLAVIESNGFVFAADLTANRDEDRWEKLAFSLYTDICEIDVWARQALDVPLGVPVDGPAGEPS